MIDLNNQVEYMLTNLIVTFIILLPQFGLGPFIDCSEFMYTAYETKIESFRILLLSMHG